MKYSLNCTASTKKKEVLDFCNKHKGKIIVLHYENNMYGTFCDDDIQKFSPDKFEELIKIVNKHYIHGVWTTNKE